MVSVEKGRILIYRLFDVAQEIDLSMIDRLQREGSKRLKFSKNHYMKALEFANPPISFELAPFSRQFFNAERSVSVFARAYDFGVISISFDLSIPEKTSFEEIETAAAALDADGSIEEKARQYVASLVESLGEAVKGPEIKEGFVEDYMVFYIERLSNGMTAREFLDSYDPARLLLYESRQISPFMSRETLAHSFSYYPDDLVIVHTDNALIIEPSGAFDLPDILEFANAQIFELRFYDAVMDRELAWIYSELSRRRVSMLGLRRYEKLARKMTQTVLDVTEVTGRVNNSLKVTEDVYYARIYRTFMALLRSRDWEVSINGKLQVVMNTYKMIHDEISIKRGYAVEVGIFILILIEMGLAMYR